MRSADWPDVGSALGWLGALFWTQTMGRTLVRALPLPAGPRVIAVGGATLGGSGKTPLAIACAEHLVAMGARVTIVGHAYRARPGRARIVSPSDRLDEVGDEALLAARAFATSNRAALPLASGPQQDRLRPHVVVAPRRVAAIAAAARGSDVLILDGVAQTAPTRASLALLALDALQPWGRKRALPPAGDLRAAIPALVGACDALVTIHDAQHQDRSDEEAAPTATRLTAQAPSHVVPRGAIPHRGKEVFAAHTESRGAWDAAGVLLTWDVLRSVRVGLLTALARPERVIAALARRGVRPRLVLVGRDHGPISAGAAIHERERRAPRIDLWLATPKCALHAERARLVLPLATLDYSVVLPPRLCARLAHVMRTSSSRDVP